MTTTGNWVQCEDIRSPRDRKIISIEENGKKYIGKNSNSKITRTIRVDGCLINDSSSNKCDYILLNEDDKIVFFIELKGCDIKHAAVQITETIKKLGIELSEYGTFLARIVCSECPPNMRNTPQFLALLRQLKKYNGDVKIKQNKLEEVI